jgi:hypothetical protein
MDTTIKSSYNPSNLSYYTTWWLASTSSISSQNTLSSVLDNDIPVVTDRKKQVNICKLFRKNDLFFSFRKLVKIK